MKTFLFSEPAHLRRFRLGSLFSACVGFSLLTVPLHAGLMPANLGNGLDALVESNQKLKADPSFSPHKLKKFNGNATQKAANIAPNAIHDSAGRTLVRISANGLAAIADVQAAAAAAAPSMKIQATNATYHGAGVFEAWVSLDDVPALAGVHGVGSVFLSLKPVHAKVHQTLPRPAATVGEVLSPIGTVYDFGVTQHLVDQINRTYNPNAPFDFEGDGISIGILSDSYDTGTTYDPSTGAGVTTHAADDVASGDLPGASGSAVNAQPVVVLQDYVAPATDEGRGMAQTVFKMAPHARLGFATADLGEVDFGNEIRALAGVLQYPASVQQGFAADVVVDDVSYLDEPFFQDGIVAQAVNDVVNAGVSYFSSAANNFGSNGYDSDFRFVANGTGLTAAAGNTALAGTNINLANVPTNLYAGGFHNFNPSGLDVAQLVNYPSLSTLENSYNLTSISTILQWNDPDDTTTPSINTPPVFTGTGTITYNPATMAGNTVSFQVPLTQGQQYLFQVLPAATPTTPGDNPLDAQIAVFDPSGQEVSFTDVTGSGQEEDAFDFAPVSGTYTVVIGAFEIPTDDEDITDGSFTLNVYTANGTQRITQDLNLLVFDTSGNYIPADSAVSNNIANNSPIEFTAFAGPANGQVQFVIARSSLPPATGRVANHLRYLCFGDGITPLGPAEYINYTAPMTFGHSCAAGANGVAAYAFYHPSIPESFTSPGPSTIYFDANNNALPAPQVRLKPDVAAMDGANTTFFGGDSLQDQDTNPNFFGTSDAAPHAAAIGALVLQANGGRHSLTPAQVKGVLQGSAFMHDLDPYFASGSTRTSDGGKVTFTVTEDESNTTATQDPNALTINYVGAGSLATFVFNPSGSPATGGDVTGGNNGITAAAPHTYFSNSTPGLLFGGAKAFTVGGASSGGLQAAGAVTSSLTNPATNVSNGAGRFFTLNLGFPTGAFTGGSVLRFAVGRYENLSADVTTAGGNSVPNRSADLLGGGVSLPDGTERSSGMTFSGTTSSGATFSGVVRNRLGFGYSVLDGYGFINAEAAILFTPPQ